MGLNLTGGEPEPWSLSEAPYTIYAHTSDAEYRTGFNYYECARAT